MVCPSLPLLPDWDFCWIVGLTEAEYKCATCNGALPELDGHAVRFAMGMVTLTVLSFTWFAGGYGVFAV